MNLRLEIKNNESGKTVSDVWQDWKWHKYWFEEGNASCDCNRELFFERAKGNEPEWEIECSEGRYSIRATDNDTGEVLYDEISANVKM